MARALTASDLLDAWERGLPNRAVQRALDLLALTYPESSLEQLQELPIGQRDARLLAIREALFGPRLTCLATCPRCNERLEIAFDITQLRSSPSDSTATETLSITEGSVEVQFRLPNSSDMLLISDLPDATQARRTLFERCVQQATRDGVPITATNVPEEIVNAVAVQMALIDPQADIQIALDCPACAHQWSAAFDIVSYLWSEVNAWAVRILHEVHQLASAYGWREADILALSPMRRQFYLELIG